MKSTIEKVYTYRGIDKESYGRTYKFISRELGWNDSTVTLQDTENGGRRSMGAMEFSHFYDLNK